MQAPPVSPYLAKKKSEWFWLENTAPGRELGAVTPPAFLRAGHPFFSLMRVFFRRGASATIVPQDAARSIPSP